MSQQTLNRTKQQIKVKSGLAANINATATKNLAVQGELHYATDTESLYIFDGTQNILIGGLGSEGVRVVSASTDTVLITDKILNIDYTSTGACTVTIPSSLIAISGFSVGIKDSGGNAGANNITVETEGSETIDGSANAVITGNYNFFTFYSDGSNLFIK